MNDGNLSEATNDELQDALTVAQREGDERWEIEFLSEIKRRQETLARRGDLDIIRATAARCAPPVPITGTPLITDAETGKKYGY